MKNKFLLLGFVLLSGAAIQSMDGGRQVFGKSGKTTLGQYTLAEVASWYFASPESREAWYASLSIAPETEAVTLEVEVVDPVLSYIPVGRDVKISPASKFWSERNF